ncbi:hypothetical protein BFW01_g1728 [Lasiodiplodia theobromae]|nr:hypothetical protein BFW01_g1728 [Lasiodiplodia theobromae]
MSMLRTAASTPCSTEEKLVWPAAIEEEVLISIAELLAQDPDVHGGKDCQRDRKNSSRASRRQ